MAAVAARAQDDRKPNIVFLLADDLGYGDLGCFGQQVIQTPNIDRLAAEGVRCTSVYAGSTVCAPSRCCLMTGYHTGHALVRNNGGPGGRPPLGEADLTVGELLQEAGYRTGCFGKWALGEAGSTGTASKKGFDEFYGYLSQSLAHLYYPHVLWHNETTSLQRGNWGGRQEDYSHDVIFGRAMEWVGSAAGEPFFLYLPFTIPHANNEAGRNLGDGMEVPDYGIYAEETWPNTEKGFAAMVTRMDRDVGRLLDRLEELGVADNTVVFFSSDNGPHREGGHRPEFFGSQGGLRGIKRDLYEGGIRVPTIVKWPGRIPAGSVSDVPWAFWDLLPTAAAIAGVDAPEGTDGVSVLPALEGNAEQLHDYLYWEFVIGGKFRQAVRAGKWKAVRYAGDAATELYDLDADRGETKDLAAKNPERVRKLEALFETARSDSKWFPVPAG